MTKTSTIFRSQGWRRNAFLPVDEWPEAFKVSVLGALASIPLGVFMCVALVVFAVYIVAFFPIWFLRLDHPVRRCFDRPKILVEHLVA